MMMNNYVKALVVCFLIVLFGGSLLVAGCPESDLNKDCRVNIYDFAIFAEQWMEAEGSADLDGLNGVDAADLFLLTDNWLEKKEYVIVSEFGAVNKDVLFDEDGDSSDWIELYNPTRVPMSLEGWYLTDDADDPAKWRLPSVILEAGEFLTVFASEKDRRDPAANLHTNFKLDAEGEYLALIQEDGSTVAFAYEPDFGVQYRDISFGVVQQGSAAVFAEPTSPAKLLIPSASDDVLIGSSWTGELANEPFDDSEWSDVSAAVGYDTRTGADEDENIALFKPAIQSSIWEGYPASMGTDGILTNFTHTATGDMTPWWLVDLGETFVINQIVIHNRDSCCQERLYNIVVEIYDAQGTVVYTSDRLNPVSEGSMPSSPGEFLTVDLSSQSSGGVSGRTINISKIPVSGATEYLSLGEVVVHSVENYAEIIESDIETEMKGINASCYLRIPFQVVDTLQFDNLLFRINYDDGFAAYLNGSLIASANAPEGSIAYNAEANATHLAGLWEEYSVPVSLLRTGRNILAIHGLNYTADDVNFLIVPELAAYQLELDGTAYFPSPTPGYINNQGVVGFVADTTFDVDRGFYDDPFDVHITTVTPGAGIIYTTDGSKPSLTNGIKVSPVDPNTPPLATVHIASTTVLRAAAFKEEHQPSNTDTHTYIFLDDVISSDVMDTAITEDPRYAPQMHDALTDLPTLSLVADDTIDDNQEYEVGVSVEWILPDGSEGFQENAGVKYFGGWWAGPFAKQNFRLYFRSEYGAGKLNYPLFEGFDRGIEAVEVFDQLSLRAGSHDMVERGFYMSNRFTDDTMLDMGNLNPHGRFVHLYLNGTYWGQYHLRERWNADMHAEYLGGRREDYEAINGNLNVGGWAFGDAYDGDGLVWERISFMVDGVPGPPYSETILPYLDTTHYIDYMLMFMFGNSEDEYRCVSPVLPGGGFKWFLNDADGFTRDAGDRTYMAQPGRYNGDGPGSIFSMLLAEGNPDYKTLLADRIHKHFFNDGAMTPGKNTIRLLERCNEVERAFIAEAARWGYRTPDSWKNARDSYVNYVLPYRTATVIDQFKAAGFYPDVDAPVFNINDSYLHGGYVNAGDMLSITFPSSGTNIESELVAAGVSVRAHVPVDDSLGLAWTANGFTPDNDWTDGSTETGVGYERGTGYESLINTDVESEMYDISASVFCRLEFTFDGSEVEELTLQMKYDDAFIAYLNGVEVCRTSNITNDTPGSAAAYPDHEASFDIYEDFDITSYKYLLSTGTNVLGIHGINATLTSSDMLILPRMVTMTSNLSDSAPVWYTTNGSDPRLSGGSINPGAVEYSDPITLTKSTLVKARALDDGTWSALNEAVFAVGPVYENLRITEIMYHPADPNTEFIELKNIGNDPVNLNLVSFPNGVDFTFPAVELLPGAYAIVVENIAEFTARYGGIIIAGQYTGALDNAGERIELADAVGTVIHDFEYKDDWYDITDGGGFSLTIKDPAATDPNLWNDKPGWRPSAVIGGSPREDDSGIIPQIGAIVINELLAHSDLIAYDWIELYNKTDEDINIGGWFMSDNNNDDPNRMKYEIPAGTVIEAYDYEVFNENIHFGNPDAEGCNIPFQLSENGETVYLQSGQDGVLTGYYEEEKFGASEADIAFGRYEKSTGTFNFVAMSANTPGSANAYPKVGPIVISEIMYHPQINADAEYVELVNISTSSVTLYDSTTDEPWRFVDDDDDPGLEFYFPSNTPVTIDPDEKILLIKNAYAFKAEFGQTSLDDIRYYEWLDGSLSNGGEKPELQMPGDVDELGTRYYIRVDRVSYDDELPWPTEADGSGQSLTKKADSLDLYGNDPINWESDTTSPGE
jgi:hypothetical protein